MLIQLFPTAYIEKPPFPVRMKEHAKASTVVNKSYGRRHKPSEKIRVEPSVVNKSYFCDEASRIAKPEGKDKHKPVVGMPVVSTKIGHHCYHGLCDLGASVSDIPSSLYQEIKDEIAPAEIEGIDVTIKLANRDTISPIGILRDVEVLCGKIKYPT